MLQVTVFREFFVALHLPSSVIRGEALAIEMVVFNYGSSNVSSTVKLHNDAEELVFPDFINEIDQACEF